MWYVYVLKSKSSNFRYVGSTNSLKRRLGEHNEGSSQSTKAYRPFHVEMFVCVDEEWRARKLEKYFKTGSGRAVLRKRLLMIEQF